MAYVIKRYANRKLYDVQVSRYVTLEDLEQLIRRGKEVSVVDAATGEDLTALVLTEIILRGERGGRAVLPAGFLHLLIKHGDAWQKFMAKGLYSTLEGLIDSQREANRIFEAWASWSGMLPPKHPPGAQEPAAGRGPAPADSENDRLRDEVRELKAKLRGLEQAIQGKSKPKRRR